MRAKPSILLAGLLCACGAGHDASLPSPADAGPMARGGGDRGGGAPATGGGDARPREDFDGFFARMQADPAFARSRVAPDFKVIEYFSDDTGGPVSIERTTACDGDALRTGDWAPVADARRFEDRNSRYLAPQARNGQTVVTLAWGPHVDGALYFEAVDGKWRLARQDVVYEGFDPREPLPPLLPCATLQLDAAGGPPAVAPAARAASERKAEPDGPAAVPTRR